jgi:predicted dehydrogenase
MPGARVVLIGVGGYGNIYLEELLRGAAEGRLELAGTVDPAPAGCRYLKELEERRVPLFGDVRECFESERADLAIVSTPIQFHGEHVEQALAAGASVLCEKPVAATIQEALQMQAAAELAPGFVAIGYQWSFAEPVLALKRDVLLGRLGRPRRLKALICWPRPESYYTRNQWAGRIALSDGRFVLDSPAHNAMAHYLHNMFYVLGATQQASSAALAVSAELYRANAIENYDTVALRCETEAGAPLLFYATHSATTEEGPLLEYEFEHAVVHLGGEAGHHLRATFSDGRQHDYGEIHEYPQRGYYQKLWLSLAALEGGPAVPCTIASALPQVVCVNGAQRRHEDIDTFEPSHLVWTDTPQGRLCTVSGLQQELGECYRDWTLPGDRARAAWARPSTRVDLRDYTHFSLGQETPA